MGAEQNHLWPVIRYSPFPPAGSALVYSSFLGGSNADIGYGVAVDPSGNPYVAGQTCSTDFPTVAPLQPGTHGNCDAFVAKTATGPSISVSPGSLNFPAQPLGTTSSPQTVTVLSNGDSPLSISSIAITGDFAETDNCAGASLAIATSCTINVTFTPTAAGNRNGGISITDNAPGSPHTVNLVGGTGSTFTLSTSPPSVTVVAGNSVTFALAVTPSAVVVTWFPSILVADTRTRLPGTEVPVTTTGDPLIAEPSGGEAMVTDVSPCVRRT